MEFNVEITKKQSVKIALKSQNRKQNNIFNVTFSAKERTCEHANRKV